MKRTITALALLAALAAAGCGSSSSSDTSSNSNSTPAPAKPAKQAFDPSRFVHGVDNPMFPLKPGTVFRYRVMKDGKLSTEFMTVTNKTRRVAGVDATVVHDVVYTQGKPSEDTDDWYAQDRDGNVWYMGEATRELDRSGKTTTTEGSWEAGVHGARAGIFMPARPKVGQSFQQEYLKGHAEDRFLVVSLDDHVQVPYGAMDHALRTREWTPLEPGVIDRKYYVHGVGMVLEDTVKGGKERAELMSVKHG
jgi:hypothetical protein